jgi:hypothetical protein
LEEIDQVSLSSGLFVPLHNPNLTASNIYIIRVDMRMNSLFCIPECVKWGVENCRNLAWKYQTR